MQSVATVIVDLKIDAATLERMGAAESQCGSWKPDRRSDEGFVPLVRSIFPSLAPNGIRSLLIETPSNAESFLEILQSASAELEAELSEGLDQAAVVLLINLLPYLIGPTQFDRVIQGLLQPGSPATRVPTLILLKNCDHLGKSAAFRNLRGELSAPFAAVDLRGWLASLDDAREVRYSEIDRTPFSQILKADGDSVYRSLIHETNLYLGHFALPNSHIRTHYDLSEFVRREDVWEFIQQCLAETVAGEEPTLILGTGFEISALSSIGTSIQQTFSTRLVSDYRYVEKPAQIRTLGSLDRWSRVLLLTDIINTGETIGSLIRAIRDRAENKPRFLAFSIARMSNSPHSIEEVDVSAALEIRRPYYTPKDCRLCDLDQPKVTVKSASDFTTVRSEQMTPFDFWEAVHDSKALVKSDTDARGRHFDLRVDSKELIRCYRPWIKNLVRAKVEGEFSTERPRVICTVDEPSGIRFAQVVREALGVREELHVVPLHVLDRVTPTKVPEGGPDGLAGPVLVVDDGINYGGTVRSLILYCIAAGRTPMGALVIDNRLSLDDVARIESSMAHHPILSLYTWRSRTDRL